MLKLFAREESAEERTARRVREYAQVFGSPEGKRVLADMRRSYRDTFCSDPHESSFRQGKRQVVLDIERLLEIAHDPKFGTDTVTDFFGNSAGENEE